MKISALALGLAGIATLAATSASADVYMRKGKEPINVQIRGDRLYCTRQSDGFEMCNGMAKKGAVWQGGNMKHPDMPGFMTFNGTVRMAGASLNIKGCAVGQSMCDSETWTKK